MDKFVRAAWAGERPSDGYFVTFWRRLLDYPEILAWEKRLPGSAGILPAIS